MAGVRLEFAQFGHFDYFNIYRNSVSIAIENLEQPIGISSTMYYEDLTVELNKDYYYRIGVVRDSIEEFSEEIHVRTEVMFDPPYNLIVEFKNDESNRLKLNWSLDGFIDEQRYYCSETPFTSETKPIEKVVLANNIRSYVDTAVETGKNYHIAVGSIKNGVEKLSEVKLVRTGDEYWANVVSLLHFENGIIDETGRSWDMVGSPVVQNGVLVLNGSSGLTTSGTGFNFGTADFTIEAFLKQTTPNARWREIFMANVGGGMNIMLYDRKLAAGRELITNDYISTQEAAQNEFKHIAFSRNAGVLRGFIDGNKVIEGSWLHSISSSALHSIGSKKDGTSGLVGSIDQFRVTNGVGRYTSDFTPQDFLNF